MSQEFRRRRGGLLAQELDDLVDGDRGESQDGKMERILEDQGSKSFVQPGQSLLLKNSAQAVKKSFVSGHDGNHFATRVQIVDNGPAALEVKSVKKRLDGVEEDVGREEAGQGGDLTVVLLKAGHDAAALSRHGSLVESGHKEKNGDERGKNKNKMIRTGFTCAVSFSFVTRFKTVSVKPLAIVNRM